MIELEAKNPVSCLRCFAQSELRKAVSIGYSDFSGYCMDLWKPLLLAACLLQPCLFCVSTVFAAIRRFDWVLTQTNVSRLCTTQDVVTVNGKFPGPTLRVREGDFVVVNVLNNAKYNATIHWHGLKQMRNPWSDGPAYITQCPIQPGQNFSYRFKIRDQHGTLFWHAHWSWLRATVHGAIVILPKKSQRFPYALPAREEIIIFGEWWNYDPIRVVDVMMLTGNAPKLSDALTINGQPGDAAPCSAENMTRIQLSKGERILLRLINAGLNQMNFMGIAKHKLTVVAVDALYTKPFETDYIVIDPGQTVDVLLEANQRCGNSYYMATHAYWSRDDDNYDNTTATALFEYASCASDASELTFVAHFPELPEAHDADKGEAFFNSLRSLNSPEHPSVVPEDPVDINLFYVEMIGIVPCDPGIRCGGVDGQKVYTAINNITMVLPQIPILEAYYFGIRGVYTTDFPDAPTIIFNYMDPDVPVPYAEMATKVRVLEFNSTVQLVMQASGFFGGESHNFHLHGHDFYVVGRGFGNYDPVNHPKTFNLVDPPKRNTFNLPLRGWTVIRFVADNPGVWFMHCHLDYHMSIGMAMAFITLDGPEPQQKVYSPPVDFPVCASAQLEQEKQLWIKGELVRHPVFAGAGESIL